MEHTHAHWLVTIVRPTALQVLPGLIPSNEGSLQSKACASGNQHLSRPIDSASIAYGSTSRDITILLLADYVHLCTVFTRVWWSA